MIKVKECKEANTLSGLYLQLTGSYRELSILGKDKAKEMARKYGFNPEGKSDSGYPVLCGLDTYTKSYWFFERR